MHPILGFVSVHQVGVTSEATVDMVSSVSSPCRRGVRQHDVHTSCSTDLTAQSSDASLHLCFAVLVRTAIVQHAAAQPKDAHALADDELILDTITSFRRSFCIRTVVVTMNIE